MKQAVIDYGRPATAATAWFLAAGVALYVAALVLFRTILDTGPRVPRLVTAAACLPTVVVGLEVSPEAQLTAVTVILVAGIILDRRVAILRGQQHNAELP